MAADLFDSWFRIADKDRDGLISGAEAVEFFQRSNLSQDTLFKVWNLVAGDRPSLTKPQFYSTLRLISLAQKSNGQLPDSAARSTLIGMGPALPPPIMVGLESTLPNTSSWQSTQQASQDPFAPKPVAARSPRTAAAYPPMQDTDLQRYKAMFGQMDRDRDGVVQGGDCFAAFMQWGLPKGILKDIWAVVAGDNGQLTEQEFLACLYLMDQAKRGIPPPASLPPGPFPPISAAAPPQPSWQQLSRQASRVSSEGGAPQGFSLDAVQRVQHDVFEYDLPVPQMPKKIAFEPPKPAAVESQVPRPSESVLNQMGPLERQRLENDTTQAQDAEAKLNSVREVALISKVKEELFRNALQSLTLFKSRTAAALLQAQERAQAATSEADAMEAQYQAAWANAEATQSKSTALLDQLTKAKARKAEMTTKLAELHKDIEALGSISEEQVQDEERAISALLSEVAAAEAKKEQLDLRTRGLGQEKERLQAHLEGVQAGIKEAEATAEATTKDLDALVDKLKTGDDSAALEIQARLRKSAATHRALIQHATAAAITIPEEANLGVAENSSPLAPKGPAVLQWSEFATAQAADWEDFEDEGIDMVMELPNETRYTSPLTAKPAAPEDEVAQGAPAASDNTPEATETPAPAGGASHNGLRSFSDAMRTMDSAASNAADFDFYAPPPSNGNKSQVAEEDWAAF